MKNLAFVLLVACGGSKPAAAPVTNTPPTTEPAKAETSETAENPEAKTFALHMLDAIEKEDAAAWNELLATSRRATTPDLARAKQHMVAWRQALLPKVGELKTARFWLADKGGDQVVMYQVAGGQESSLVHVTKEDGALRINEN